MDWASSLKDLPVVIASLLVFTGCLRYLLRFLSKNVVDPFKELVHENNKLVGNHMNHLAADQQADREERAKMRESIDRQTIAIEKQSEQFGRLCDKVGK